MPHGRYGFKLVVDRREPVVQHARAPYELHVGAETSQIVEREHHAPQRAGRAVDDGHGVQVVDVDRYAEQHEVSQEILVEVLHQRPAAVAAVVDGVLRPDGHAGHQPVRVVHDGDELV